MNDFEGHSRSLEVVSLDKPCVILFSGVKQKRLYLAQFSRYYHIYVNVTSCDLQKSFSSTRQLKLQATYALSFVCKYVAVTCNTSYVSEGVKLTRVSNS